MRSAGILMHISSLPGESGIGTMGVEAYHFVDFLSSSGMKYWQLLPIGPVGFSNSPYQSVSSFAGNPLLIDLWPLKDRGLLQESEIRNNHWGARPDQVDFPAVKDAKEKLLRLAYERGKEVCRDAVDSFSEDNPWVRDYAAYMALQERFGGKPWTEWDCEDTYVNQNVDDVRFYVFVQTVFYDQWERLRRYANGKGVRLIGDIPIYVPLDSADVRANPEQFRLDEKGNPTQVAGVPPDYFSADGQLWGNPLYRWDDMDKDGFAWWVKRLKGVGRLFDVVRIDHFRGLESYWSVPAQETTARNGRWEKGPGERFVDAVRQEVPELEIIAEDLGTITPEVHALREYAGWPGMKVMQFAFEPWDRSTYLPHRCEENCVYYTGTHDNATLVQWIREARPEQLAFAREYLGAGENVDLREAMLRAGMRSGAGLFIVPLQDLLGLGAEARMNTPGTVSEENWRWRMMPDALTPSLAEWLRRMTDIYGR